VLPVISVTSWL